MHYVNPIIKDLFRVPQPENRGKYLRLDQNENPDGIPEWLLDTVKEKITPEFLSIYPEETKLTEKYAALLGKKLENVTLTDGSVVGMGYVIKVFGESGKDLISVTPSFGMYKVYAQMAGMNTRDICYEKDFSFDVSKLLTSIDSNTGIVAIVNPNMPMGNVYSKEEILSIVEKAKENNSLVIIDEAYYYFNDDTSIDLIDTYDNVVILRTFSKMLSIPALRIGAIISSKSNIQYLNNYKPHYTVNSIALLLGEAIVCNHDRVVKELKEKFIGGRDYFYNELKRLGYSYIPSNGCFVCIAPKHKTPEVLTNELKEKGILILCGKGDLSGFLRVTVWDKKYMQKFISVLEEIDK